MAAHTILLVIRQGRDKTKYHSLLACVIEVSSYSLQLAIYKVFLHLRSNTTTLSNEVYDNVFKLCL